MKQNSFGEPILQPGDDIVEEFETAFEFPPTTAFSIDLDPNFGWCAMIENDEGDEMQIHDFESEDELREALLNAGLTIDEDRG